MSLLLKRPLAVVGFQAASRSSRPMTASEPKTVWVRACELVMLRNH